jgi:type I restriction enzyme S subunit
MTEKNKPTIRFKGFTDAWEQRKLDDFGLATSGTSIESEFSSDGKYKVISIGSYSENSVYTDQGIRAIESEKTIKRVLNKDDLTMILNDKTTSGNIIGRVLRIEKGGVYVYNQRTQRIEPNKEKYDTLFLYQLLNAPLIREKIFKQSQGNTQIYVNWSKIKEIVYFIPSLPEQKQIGVYFQQLDNLITLHQRKCYKLVNIKKSMLEKMFPQNGSSYPEVRFEGFTDAWEQRKLGNIIDLRIGRDYKHLSEGEIPVYGTGGFMLSVNEALSYKEDAIGIGRKGTIDKPYILKAPFWTVDTLFYAVPETNNDLDFIFDIFQNINWKQKDESTGVPSLSKTAIKEIDVLIPEFKEQKIIGNFFQYIDNLITLHQRELDKLKNIKKACLEKMFI